MGLPQVKDERQWTHNTIQRTKCETSLPTDDLATQLHSDTYSPEHTASTYIYKVSVFPQTVRDQNALPNPQNLLFALKPVYHQMTLFPYPGEAITPKTRTVILVCLKGTL